jgi:hypothetical protein
LLKHAGVVDAYTLFLLRGDAKMRFLFISQGQKAVKDRDVLVIVLSGGHGKRMG